MADEVINGTDLFVFIEGEAVAHATSHTLSIKMATRATSNKDSGLYETKAAGRFDITASCDAMMVYDNFETILSLMNAREPVTVDFGKKGEGVETLDEDVFYASGEFLITSFDPNAGDAANATYTVSFEHHHGFTMNLDGVKLFVKGIGYNPVSAAAATAGAAVFVRGGIAPYTYEWTFGAGGCEPIIEDKAIAAGIKAAVSPGTVYTCTVTDSSLNTGEVDIVLIADGA